nr:uncharacterized protein LOC115269692 [Aedes albopictus]XP_029734382.1 uncharacterized protein LOC115269692 [Aedes albopictus]
MSLGKTSSFAKMRAAAARSTAEQGQSGDANGTASRSNIGAPNSKQSSTLVNIVQPITYNEQLQGGPTENCKALFGAVDVQRLPGGGCQPLSGPPGYYMCQQFQLMFVNPESNESRGFLNLLWTTLRLPSTRRCRCWNFPMEHIAKKATQYYMVSWFQYTISLGSDLVELTQALKRFLKCYLDSVTLRFHLPLFNLVCLGPISSPRLNR